MDIDIVTYVHIFIYLLQLGCYPVAGELLLRNVRDISTNIYFLRGEAVSLTPNPQPGGPGYPILSGSSPLTYLAWKALPLAKLPPA